MFKISLGDMDYKIKNQKYLIEIIQEFFKIYILNY
jgi:hypothetical protein